MGEIARELSRLLARWRRTSWKRAQQLSRSRLQLRMEDTRAVSAWYGAQEILALPRMTPEQAIARSEAVTIDDLQRVGRRLISDERLHVALVGPVEGETLMSGVTVDG